MWPRRFLFLSLISNLAPQNVWGFLFVGPGGRFLSSESLLVRRFMNRHHDGSGSSSEPVGTLAAVNP